MNSIDLFPQIVLVEEIPKKSVYLKNLFILPPDCSIFLTMNLAQGINLFIYNQFPGFRVKS